MERSWKIRANDADHIGSVSEIYAVKTVTLVADTSIYADNDVLAVAQEITGVAHKAGGRVVLESVLLLDKDDQGTEVELLFMNATGTLGTINAALSLTDAVAATIVGSVGLLTYSDLINSQTCLVKDINLPMQCASGSTSLWIGAVVRSGTPTYTASGLVLQLGFRRVG